MRVDWAFKAGFLMIEALLCGSLPHKPKRHF
jgi:hypothetical protein